jgi:hypothetical protein
VEFEVQVSGRWYGARGQVAANNRSRVEISLPPSSSLTLQHAHPLDPNRPLVVTGVRYGWGDWPVCSLFNADPAGLPALPFLFNWPDNYDNTLVTVAATDTEVEETPRTEEAAATWPIVGLLLAIVICWYRWSFLPAKGKLRSAMPTSWRSKVVRKVVRDV